MPTPNGADRAKALRIRRKLDVGGAVSPEDSAWLHDYERAQEENKRPRDVGASASRSRRTVVVDEEQEAASVGTGSAAEIAAAAAMTREEGRRIDTLTNTAVGALARACDLYHTMVEDLLARAQADAEVHRELLSSVRTHFIERTQAEAELIRQGEDKDGLSGLATQLLPFLMEHMKSGGKKQ